MGFEECQQRSFRKSFVKWNYVHLQCKLYEIVFVTITTFFLHQIFEFLLTFQDTLKNVKISVKQNDLRQNIDFSFFIDVGTG